MSLLGALNLGGSVRIARPALLLALLLVPIAVAVFWSAAQQRRHKAAVEFSDPELLALIAPDTLQWRRHVAVWTTVVGLALMAVAGGRVEVVRGVAESSSRVVLVLDVSGSMAATDLAPDRLSALKVAAKRFVDKAPLGVEIAVVAFSSGAQPMVAPTTDKTKVKEGIDALTADGGTAIGDAIYAGMGLLETAGWAEGPGLGTQKRKGALVLMSDGESNAGREPLRAAEAAHTAGVVISTVALGTGAGVQLGNGATVGVDTATLSAIAQSTGGTFRQAEGAGELTKVFEDLAEAVRAVRRWDPIGEWFAVAAMLVVAAGALFAISRTSRLL